jgi:hypothetical protein
MTAVPNRAAQAFVIILIAFQLPAFACSITVTEHLKYAFKQAPVVVDGTALRIVADGTTHFRVHRQWKGQPVSDVAVPNPKRPALTTRFASAPATSSSPSPMGA